MSNSYRTRQVMVVPARNIRTILPLNKANPDHQPPEGFDDSRLVIVSDNYIAASPRLYPSLAVIHGKKTPVYGDGFPIEVHYAFEAPKE